MIKKDDLPILVSFSGGKTSAFMARYLQQRYPGRQMLFVFANTGREREETLEFVEECDRAWGLGVIWLEAVVNPEFGKGTQHKVVSFETAARNGEPFEAVIQKYGIPSMAFPHCSRELKAKVIESYVKWWSVLSPDWQFYRTAIGIRSDEKHRINRGEAARRGWIYPLTDELQTTRKFIDEWWEKQPFNLRLQEHQGNCDFCWKKSDAKLVRLIQENADRLDWWIEMERKYSERQIAHRKKLTEPTYFFRQNRSAVAMHALAQNVASGAVQQNQLSLFEMDCFCKST